jgi:transmembrane 9 superfamily protein 2/4
MLLSSIIGTGIQLFCILFATLLLSVLGFLNPDRRSNLLTLGLLFFVFMGIPGGYTSSKFYRLFGGGDWVKNSILTAFFFPGILFIGYSCVNILLSIEGSSASVNFLDIASLLLLWLCCSSPLVLIGSFFGIKSKMMTIPCKVNAVPTTIPSKKWYFHLRFTFWIAGILSFSTIFIELVYVMASLWRHQIYFLATFLWISFLVLIIVSIEITIILTYVNLCYGDYVWWWKSFALGGSSGIYIIIYTIYYFFNLKITRLSAMIVYFGIMGMISVIVFLVCGGISTIVTFFVLRQIYSMIKVD